MQRASGLLQAEVRIGRAIVDTPNDWLLVSARSQRGGNILAYGFLPEFLAPKFQVGKNDPFVFLISCDGRDSISLREPGEKEINGMYAMMERLNAGYKRRSGDFVLAEVDAWQALLMPGELAIIGIPDLALVLTVSDLRLVPDLHIRSADDNEPHRH